MPRRRVRALRRGRARAGRGKAALRLGAALLLMGGAMMALVLLFTARPAGSAQTGSAPASSALTSSAPEGSAAFFETYLAPLAAGDPAPFADLAHADRDWMLKTALWAAAAQNQYAFDADGRQRIPQADVLLFYRRYFGASASPDWRTFSSGGVEYAWKDGAFAVPVAAAKDVSSLHVTEVRAQGGATLVTAQVLPGAGWTGGQDGSAEAPAPAKTARYTLVSGREGYAVSKLEYG